ACPLPLHSFPTRRSSDLLDSSLRTARGWFNSSYTATVQTTYEPALDIWSFPLGENETWNVSSNATIRAMIQWHFEGPSASFGFWHTFNATVPIRTRQIGRAHV